MQHKKHRYLFGKSLQAYLVKHSRLARALKRAHVKAKVLVLKRRRVNLARRVIHLAAHYEGVKEYPAGSNLTMFGKWYGENGVAWCAIFVSFILSHAGRAFRWAYVPAVVAAARANSNGLSVIQASQVNTAIGAGHPVLVCFDWENDGTADHIGIAVHYDAKLGQIHTIEGNTGNDNWSNGGEVLAEVRAVSLVQAFVKVANG